MTNLAVFTDDKSFIVGFFTDKPSEAQMLEIPFPKSHSDFEEAVKQVVDAVGGNMFDVGVSCYGMTEQTDKIFLDLDDTRAKSLRECEYGSDISNMAAVFVWALKPKKARLVYPLTYNPLPEIAKLSGIPQIERRVVARTLEHIMSGNKKKTVSIYLSEGEISVAAQADGKIIDITNSYDGEGAMTPTRSGFFQQRCAYKMALSDEFTKEELLSKVRENGGLIAHLGTSDVKKVQQMIDSGDKKARLIYDAMVYTIAKEVGRMATALCGEVDVVTLHGPLAWKNKRLVSDIANKVSYIAPVKLGEPQCLMTYLDMIGAFKE